MARPEKVHTLVDEDGENGGGKRHKNGENGGANNSAAESYEARRARRDALKAQRDALPVASAREGLMRLLVSSRALVLVGETGSGKTTQVPQFLLDGGYASSGAIAVTQPRRVAAMSVARRVAEEVGTPLGQKVGYCIRFDDMSSPNTKIKYMTDGMLLREALIDPLLTKYTVVIVDEAHERTVQTDVLLGLLKGVLSSRGPEFRLIVMSATLDAGKFVSYLPGAKAAYVQGRTFPISLMYTAAPEDSYMDGALNTVLQVHNEEPAGDVLVFLTGQDEIESMERLLTDRASGAAVSPSTGQRLVVACIYASMPPEQQMRVFEAPSEGCRKVVLATNIAETSITIAGVRYVVDTGMVKARGYNAKLGLDSLQVVPVSQAQARQRSGRAGREAPGKAYRLFTERAFDALDATTLPEIQRTNLASVVLQLKALGIEDVLNFDFLDAPPRAAILRSLELLYALGALDSKGTLTNPTGVSMARLPVDPQFGKVLLASAGMGCCIEAMQLVAMVSADNIFFAPREKRDAANAARLKFTSRDGDHLTLLNVMRAFLELPRKQRHGWASDNFINLRSVIKAVDIYEQLQRHVGQLGLEARSCGDNFDPVRRALVAGLFHHAARRQPDGTYKVIASGQQVWLHPSSTLLGKKPEVVVFSELVRTTKQYAREATAVELAWLPELVPGFFAASKAKEGAGDALS